MQNNTFRGVTYPSESVYNKELSVGKGTYGIYIPGVRTIKKMMTREQIRELMESNGAVIQGQGDFRYSKNGESIIFRSANIADIVTAVETKIGWHVATRTPTVKAGQKAYVVPTMGAINSNKNDGIYPVAIFEISGPAVKRQD